MNAYRLIRLAFVDSCVAIDSHSTSVTPADATSAAATFPAKLAARLVPRDTPFCMPRRRSSRTVTMPITNVNTVSAIEKFDTTLSSISATIIIMPYITSTMHSSVTAKNTATALRSSFSRYLKIGRKFISRPPHSSDL